MSLGTAMLGTGGLCGWRQATGGPGLPRSTHTPTRLLAGSRVARWRSVPVDARPLDASEDESQQLLRAGRGAHLNGHAAALLATADAEPDSAHVVGHGGLNGHAGVTSSSLNGHHSNGHLNGHASNGHVLNGNGATYSNGNGHSNGAHSLNGSYPLNGAISNGHQAPVRVVAVRGVGIEHGLDALLQPSSSSSSSHGGHTPDTSTNGAHASMQHASLHEVTERQQSHHQASTSQASTAAGPSGGDGSSSQPAGTHEQQPQQQPQPQPEIPRPILVISLVSASLTMASCVFNTLLPVYMVTELKMNMRSMGMFEGFLEAFSYVVRMFSGVVSDMMTSRKSAITLGFAMGAMAKFGMSGATSVTQLFAAKAVDRLANGVQAAPRDALISDLAPAASRSACFGFAQSLRKWGSFLGAGLCFLLMRVSGNNYQAIFLGAASLTVASTLAFVLLVPSHARPLTPEQQQEADAQAAYQVQRAEYEAALQKQASEPASTGGKQPVLVAPAPPKQQARGFQPAKLMKDVVSMGSDFYRMLLVICMYGMGHINESMLEARAIEVGFGKAESTLVVALLALIVSISAWPLGKLDDKHGPRTTFAVGMSALILGNLTLMLSGSHPWTVYGSLIMLGVHWAVIQGPLLSIVVSLAPSHLRGTAFGIFYTVMALTTMVANSLYGMVWHTAGATSAFSLSAGLMTITLLALPYVLPPSMRHGKRAASPAPAAPAAPASGPAGGAPAAAAA